MRPDDIPSRTATECRVFARYLADVEASPYVRESYARLVPTSDAGPTRRHDRGHGDGHLHAHDLTPGLADDRVIERALLAMARRGVIATRVADGYARFFLPRSALRCRLVLMLAILENSPGSERVLNSGDEGSLFGVGARLVLTGAASVLCILVGVVLLGPVHLASGEARDARPESRP